MPDKIKDRFKGEVAGHLIVRVLNKEYNIVNDETLDFELRF